MADEINIQAVLTVQRSTMALQGSGNKPVTPTGTLASANQKTINTGSWQPINLIDGTAAAGYVLIKDTDTSGSNTVQLSLDSGGTKIFAKLRAGEFCLVPLMDSIAILHGQAFGGSVSVTVVAAQS